MPFTQLSGDAALRQAYRDAFGIIDQRIGDLSQLTTQSLGRTRHAFSLRGLDPDGPDLVSTRAALGQQVDRMSFYSTALDTLAEVRKSEIEYRKVETEALQADLENLALYSQLRSTLTSAQADFDLVRITPSDVAITSGSQSLPVSVRAIASSVVVTDVSLHVSDPALAPLVGERLAFEPTSCLSRPLSSGDLCTVLVSLAALPDPDHVVPFVLHFEVERQGPGALRQAYAVTFQPQLVPPELDRRLTEVDERIASSDKLAQSVVDAVGGTAEQIGQLAEAQAATDARINQLAGEFGRVGDRVESLGDTVSDLADRPPPAPARDPAEARARADLERRLLALERAPSQPAAPAPVVAPAPPPPADEGPRPVALGPEHLHVLSLTSSKAVVRIDLPDQPPLRLTLVKGGLLPGTSLTVREILPAAGQILLSPPGGGVDQVVAMRSYDRTVPLPTGMAAPVDPAMSMIPMTDVVTHAPRFPPGNTIPLEPPPADGWDTAIPPPS